MANAQSTLINNALDSIKFGLGQMCHADVLMPLQEMNTSDAQEPSMTNITFKFLKLSDFRLVAPFVLQTYSQT